MRTMRKSQMPQKVLTDTRVNKTHATSASSVIDAHYARLDLRKRWTLKRITSLCSFLRITESELGSILGIPHGYWRNHIRSTKPLSGPICILLTIMEAKFMAGHTKDIITNLFDYGQQKDS